MSDNSIQLSDRLEAGGRSPSGFNGARPVYVAVVQAAGAICHICVAATAERLARRLGNYVRRNATYQLWPADAERVLGLLAADRAQDAVDLYFASTGQRWDREELLVRRTGL